MKKFIICSVCILICGFLLGYITVNRLNISFGMMELTSVESPDLLYILYTNISVCIFLILGCGVVTIPLGLYQGFQLGAMLSLWVAAGNQIYIYLILTVPHCIFEIPALIIAIALGMKFARLLFNYYERKSVNVKETLFQLKYWIICVPVLLIIAGLIETFITGWLFNNIMI